MSPDDAAVLRRLVRESRVLTLAVLVEGGLDASLLPFAATADGGALLVLASGLARHTRALAAAAPFAAALHEEPAPGQNPFAIARVSFEGRVTPVPRDDARFAPLAAAYQARLPEGAMLFGLGDFGLYALGLERGRLVAGFARATSLTGDEIRAALGETSA